MAGASKMTGHKWLAFVGGRIDLRGGSNRGRTIGARAGLTRATLWALACLPVLATGPGALAQGVKITVDDVRAALLGGDQTASSQPHGGMDGAVSAFVDFAKALPDKVAAPQPHERAAHGAAGPDEVYSKLRDYVQELDGELPKLIKAEQTPSHPGTPGDDAYAALSEFARQIAPREPRIELAKAEKPKSVVKATPESEATFVGSQVCLGCHAVQAATFSQTVMGRIFRNPRTIQEKGGCETCHGAGSLHVKAGGGRGVGGIISFRPEDTSRPVAENNAICLGCHDKGGRNYWQGSVHESRDVACTNCHQVMVRVSIKGQLKKETELETCFQCHKDRRMQAQRSSHMPLREGKMTCSNCHNPHGSATEAMLKEATINDNCYKCHAEKRGPFLWEHPPVRENCLNCHEAHGSNNEYLLKVQRPRLCQDCHSIGHAAQSPLVVTAFNRSCNNCHSQIHGSNHPSGVLFQR